VSSRNLIKNEEAMACSGLQRHGTGISSVSATYQQQLVATMPFILSVPYGRVVLGQNGVVNKLFLMFPFSNKEAGVQFLKDVGLLHRKVACNTRGCCMS
jgi:hypothetical protein